MYLMLLITAAWSPSLPVSYSSLAAGASVESGKCIITVGTALEVPPYPPIYHIWLHRDGCGAPGYVLIGSSYTAPTVLLDATRTAIVAVFTFRETPSGSAAQKAQIVHVDPESGALVHSTTLASITVSGSALIEPELVQVHCQGKVVVDGRKTGVIPGETGAGDAFTATYTRFLRDARFAPPPTRVVAFSAN